MKFVKTDGKSDTYNVCENILRDDHSYYSTEKAKNVHIVLTSEEQFVLKSVYIESDRGKVEKVVIDLTFRLWSAEPCPKCTCLCQR
jgi:hypothetical protein